MAAVTVACYTDLKNSNYHKIAAAMSAGVRAFGDLPRVVASRNYTPADVGVIYGWKRHALIQQHRRFLYADLGYWNRDQFWRFAANDWSPASRMRRGNPSDRFDALGVKILPEHSGKYVLVLGASAKSMVEHGFRHMAWELGICTQLLQMRARVLFRPKPRDIHAHGIPGTESASTQSLQELFAGASLVVAHHSNGCVEAVAAGCAVYCEKGAAQPRSVPLHTWKNPPRLPGREQFLADVAYTQWTLDEMRSGLAWKHLRPSVLQ